MRTAALCAVLLASAAITLPAIDAHACGGLFCDGGGPQAVNQNAERIIFTDNGDGTITTVVQIMYEGPTDQFGWLLPVPGVPEVGISSDSVFNTLQQRSNPTFQLNRTTEGECADANRGFPTSASANNDDSCFDCNNTAEDDGGVQVVGMGQTGPYDWVVIQVDATNPDNTQAALDWLGENNYEVTSTGPELITPYLEAGMNLLAVKLQKNQEAGAVRPMTLTYDSKYPMIPIKLTAVAATDDMGVLVWVLGDSRAVPRNYKSLELNEAIINWFNPGPSYNNVINVAADEAGGQGFVTEHATTADFASEMFWTDSQTTIWGRYEASELPPSELLFQLIDEYRFLEGVRDALNGLNAGIDVDEFLNNGTLPENIDEVLTTEDVITAFDDFVITPLSDTQDLFDNSEYMTRMYTTLSPAEMTVDPEFHFNDDLPDVSNQHVADHITECSSGVTRSEAPFRVELENGLVVRGSQQGVWPFQPGDDMPTNLTVREIGESGEGEIVTDNVVTVRQQLDEHNAGVSGPGNKANAGGGCTTTAGNGAGWLVLLGLFFFGRRRRA